MSNLGKVNLFSPFILKIKDENAELRADVKYLMEQNSVMVENIGRKSTDGINQQPIDTSVSTINGQRILTPEISSLITSVNELAMKLGRESGNNIGMDKSLEFENFIFDLIDISSQGENGRSRTKAVRFRTPKALTDE